ncbi:MAG: N-acyl homoserine lactonase family protein, partial [Alphaproteobacteria bacterium]
EQVDFHEGDHELAPGISVHLCAGHAAGLQSVRVKTKRGYVMVASDATHFYMNFRDKKPFPILVNMAEMMESWKKLIRLGDSIDHVIPGHDPAVLDYYPAADPKLEGIVVRLDQAPKTSIA